MATLYSKIREDLLGKIKDGTYKEGDLLPTEAQLAELYGVSRPTVRQALQTLSDEGFVERRRRRGTVVHIPTSGQYYHHDVRRFVDEMRDIGKTVTTNVIVFHRCPASKEAAEALDIAPGEEVYKLVRLRYLDGEPRFFLETYIPCALYPGLDAYDFNNTSLYYAMSQCGSPVFSARSQMQAVLANGAVAPLLDVEEGAPILRYRQVSRTEANQIVEFTWSYYTGTLMLEELIPSHLVK